MRPALSLVPGSGMATSSVVAAVAKGAFSRAACPVWALPVLRSVKLCKSRMSARGSKGSNEVAYSAEELRLPFSTFSAQQHGPEGSTSGSSAARTDEPRSSATDTDSSCPPWLQRSQLLVGDAGLSKLARTRILLVGLGETIKRTKCPVPDFFPTTNLF